MGSTLGKAVSVAFAAVAIVELAKTYDEISRQLRDQATQVTTDTNTFIQTATKEQLEAQLKTVEEAQRQLLIIAAIPGVGVIAGDSLTELKKQADELRASIAAADAAATHLPNTGDHIGTTDFASTGEHAGKDLMEGTAAGITAGTPIVTGATSKMITDVSSLAEEMASHAGFKTGYAIPKQTADGMRAARQIVFDAIDALGEAMKHQMTPWGQAARITGFLTGKELVKGLHSQDPAVRRQADETRTIAEERLAKIIAGSGAAAKAAGKALAAGLRSKNPEIRAEAQRIKAMVDARLASTAGPAHDAGVRTGNAFANGVRAAITARMQAGINIHVNAIYNDNGHGNAIGGWSTAGRPVPGSTSTRRTPRSSSPRRAVGS
jgi:hypothetical protein